MRFPWVNVALLILLIAQLITGFLGLINGVLERQWLLWLHGVGAYAIAFVLFWKGAIILDVYQRGKRYNLRRAAFLLMLLLLLATLISGLLWTFSGPYYLLGFSLITLHMFVAVALMVLLVWHTWHLRWIFGVRKAISRRTFLRTGGLTVLGLLLWRGAAASKDVLALSGARRRFTGSYETGSFSGQFPIVSWINDRPQPIDAETWSLTVDGEVQNPLILDYAALGDWEDVKLDAILDCTGGWYSGQSWTGVPVRRLLDRVKPTENALSVTFTSVTGYNRRFTLEDAGNYLLATAVADQPLSHGHGFPLRLVAPGQRGVFWVKWIVYIRVNATSALWQLPLPLQ
ncbi:MAG: molybdopterin-dependent oxidoreductase [Candidatus Promineifilaceae bacterium]|nr:molybdopterin-dependent oxidoreductase [Candidatus Promineifilaceae bacterium]